MSMIVNPGWGMSPSFFEQINALTGSNLPVINGVIYDGDYIKYTGGPDGVADGADLTLVWAGKFASDGSIMPLYNGAGTVPFRLIRQADNTILFEGGTSGAVFSNVTSAVSASLGNVIILASCSGTTSVLKVLHAGGAITGINTPGTATNLDLTTDWYLGSDDGSSNFLDATTHLWWASATFIDFTVADNIEQFYDTTNKQLRWNGVDGSNPVDGAYSPLVYHYRSAVDHDTNGGTGGTPEVFTTFADGLSPGIYEPDYTLPLQFALVADPPEINANGNVRTYSGLSFGDANSGRVLYGVHLTSCGGVATAVLASATLDGANLTVVASGQAVDAGNNRVFIHIVKIAQADMSTPSATSGDVVFTINNVTTGGSKFMLFRGVGYNDTAADTLSVLDTTPNSGVIDFPDNGLFFGGVMDYFGATGYSWSPTVTEGFDDGMRFAGRGGIAYADAITPGLGTTVTATVTSGGGNPCALVCATFAPN